MTAERRRSPLSPSLVRQRGRAERAFGCLPRVRSREESPLNPSGCRAPSIETAPTPLDKARIARRIALTSVETSLGLVPQEVTPGGVVLRIPLRLDFVTDEHRLDPTVLSVAADAAAGVAVFVAVDRPGGVTAELRVDQLASVTPGATHLEATGRCLGVDGDLGCAAVEVRDDLGALIGHAVGVMVLDSPEAAPDGAVRCAGDFDIHDVRVTGDEVAKAIVTPGMANRRGAVHGGVIMGFAHAAQARIYDDRGVRFRSLNLGVDYLRPAAAGADLTLHSTFVRRGRRLWTLRTEVEGDDGRTVAIATGTSVVSGNSATTPEPHRQVPSQLTC